MIEVSKSQFWDALYKAPRLSTTAVGNYPYNTECKINGTLVGKITESKTYPKINKYYLTKNFIKP